MLVLEEEQPVAPEDWFASGLDEAGLLTELGRSLSELPGARYIYLDRMSRICASHDGRIE